MRILLLADTHLGFDLPLTPRVERRRRGRDFLANHLRALEPALAGEVDLVVHGGDVFHRARPHPTLVAQAFEPLLRVAEAGTPVFVVPGNHERARIPHARFAAHPLIHVFDRPRAFVVDVRGTCVALFGFPYERGVVRQDFPRLVEGTGWRPGDADVSLLCVHHCFEGATVGPADFTFRRGPDVIRCRDIPRGTAAVLTGHVHRHQVLTHDLDGRPLAAPVIYPGSTERTAFAEMGEAKGTVLLEIDAEGGGPPRVRWRFRELPARPMVVAEIRAGGPGARPVEDQLRAALTRAPEDAVLRLRVQGPLTGAERAELSAVTLRALAPQEMNVEVVLADAPWRGTRRERGSSRPRGARASAAVQPSLF
ncbi:MAG: hypothetical protein AMXMBFR53_07660 [Gemmatimonadota bacterium]